MTRLLTLFIAFVLVASNLKATTAVISTEANNTHQTYYSFEKGITGSAPIVDWDIAIEPTGDYGLRINEVTGTRLWVQPDVTHYNCATGETGCSGLDQHVVTAIDTAGLLSETNGWEELHNSYEDWKDGAFNRIKDQVSSNVVDHGWGFYREFRSTPFHGQIGYRIFIIQLRNGEFKQFFVRKSLTAGYEFCYANIDGSNEINRSIDRADYENEQFAYVSLINGTENNFDPKNEDWELMFTVYPNDIENGDATNRIGVLHRRTLQTAEKRDEDPNCAAPLAVDYTAEINTIGTDWLNASGNVHDPLVYFVEGENDTETKVIINGYNPVTGEVTITHVPYEINNPDGDAFSTNNTCFQCNDGTADVTVTGGTCPYTFAWSNGDNTQEITGLAAGQYIVTVTDNSGATFEDTVVVEEFPCDISFVSAQTTTPTCNNDANGTATIVHTNGTAPYSYSWSNGSTDSLATNLASGNHTVTITDANQCPLIETVTIDNPTVIEAIFNKGQPSCVTCNDATVQADVSGGVPGYTYNWSSGHTTATADNLAQGVYQVSITDNNGCEKIFTVETDPYICNLTVDIVSSANEKCFGSGDGSATALASNGRDPITYSWSNGVTGAALNGVPSGNYTVTATDDAGCTATANIQIDAPNPININETVTNVTCFDCTDAAIALSVNGGSGSNYTYSWDNGATTNTINSLAPGSYDVTVQDGSGCTEEKTISVPEFDCQIDIQGVVNDLNCFNDGTGNIDATVNSGFNITNVSWSSGENTIDIFNKPAGDYTLTIENDKGCSIDETFTINQPNRIQINFDVQDESCLDCEDGAIQANVVGGNGGNSFTWSNGISINSQSALEPAVYAVTVTDQNGCSVADSARVNAFGCDWDIDSSIVTDASCFDAVDGSLTIAVSNGNAPYEYRWSTGSPDSILTDLARGEYRLSITDAFECGVTVDLTVGSPEALEIDALVTNEQCVACENGAISSVISGGTRPYSYSWSNGATVAAISALTPGIYDVTVTDANDCTAQESFEVLPFQCNVRIREFLVEEPNCFNGRDAQVTPVITGATNPIQFSWSSGSSDSILTNVRSGVYTLTVIDSNSCEASRTLTIRQPTRLFATIIKTDESCRGCNNGTASLDVSGGVPPYTFSWNHGQATQSVNNLLPARYTAVVTDANGCSIQVSEDIEPYQCNMNLQSLESTIPNCFGGNDGSASITVSGGTQPYRYFWSNGETSASIFNLESGNYAVTVEDRDRCLIVENITLGSNPELAVDLVATEEDCIDCEDGTITASTQNGTAPYIYEWNHGAIGNSLTDLAPGQYQVQVTDANGCQATDSIEVDTFRCRLIFIDALGEDPTCKDLNNGSAFTLAVNTFAPITYQWSNGGTSDTLKNLVAGSYEVTITDAKGCSGGGSVTLLEPDSLFAEISSTNTSCAGCNTGSAEIEVSGGVPSYRYRWSDGQRNALAKNLPIGDYDVTVTDANGCQITKSTAVDIGTSINVINELDATAYPNPMRGDITVQWPSKAEVAMEVYLTAANGQIIPVNWMQYSNGIKFNSDDLIEGVYFITIQTENKSTYLQLIK